MLGGECFCVRGEGRWFQGRRLGTNAMGGEFCVCLVGNVFVCKAKEGGFREGGFVQMPLVENFVCAKWRMFLCARQRKVVSGKEAWYKCHGWRATTYHLPLDWQVGNTVNSCIAFSKSGFERSTKN